MEDSFPLVILCLDVFCPFSGLFIVHYKGFNIFRVIVKDVELHLADEFILLVLVVAVLEKEYFEFLCNEWFIQ